MRVYAICEHFAKHGFEFFYSQAFIPTRPPLLTQASAATVFISLEEVLYYYRSTPNMKRQRLLYTGLVLVNQYPPQLVSLTTSAVPIQRLSLFQLLEVLLWQLFAPTLDGVRPTWYRSKYPIWRKNFQRDFNLIHLIYPAIQVLFIHSHIKNISPL